MAARQSRRQASIATRARLLAAAREAFARRGFQAASVDAIADAAGLTSGALYSQFAGKDELYATVVRDSLAAHLEAYRAAFGGDGDPEQRLRAGAESWMALVARDPSSLLIVMEAWGFAARCRGSAPGWPRRSWSTGASSATRLMRAPVRWASSCRRGRQTTLPAWWSP